MGGKIADVDLANIDPCVGGCGTLVRRFANVPIAGTNRDPIVSGPWWCPDCLQAKTTAAAAGIARPREIREGAML